MKTNKRMSTRGDFDSAVTHTKLAIATLKLRESANNDSPSSTPSSSSSSSSVVSSELGHEYLKLAQLCFQAPRLYPGWLGLVCCCQLDSCLPCPPLLFPFFLPLIFFGNFFVFQHPRLGSNTFLLTAISLNIMITCFLLTFLYSFSFPPSFAIYMNSSTPYQFRAAASEAFRMLQVCWVFISSIKCIFFSKV